MKDADEQTLPGHLNDQEWRAECHCAYIQIYVADDNDDRDNNETEDEVPVKVVKLLAEYQRLTSEEVAATYTPP